MLWYITENRYPNHIKWKKKLKDYYISYITLYSEIYTILYKIQMVEFLSPLLGQIFRWLKGHTTLCSSSCDNPCRCQPVAFFPREPIQCTAQRSMSSFLLRHHLMLLICWMSFSSITTSKLFSVHILLPTSWNLAWKNKKDIWACLRL